MGSSPSNHGAPGSTRGGTVLAGRYRLDRPLAVGGMARVWAAHDQVLGRPVAVKVLLEHFAADASFVARFRAEALAAARLAHPSVVSVYDTCSTDGVEAIVMELVDGETLRGRLDREGRLELRDAARIAARIADALAVAHQAGIVHRDIKPANVLLATSGRVVVTDFGIAKATEGGDLTTGQQMLGTAKYLAPEQVESKRVDGRSDLYALGVVLYEMVCGRVPFRADTEAATALARLHRAPPPPRSLRADLTPELERVVLRLLARHRDDRWPDASSLARTLAALAAGRRLPPEPPTVREAVAPAPTPSAVTAEPAPPASGTRPPPVAPPINAPPTSAPPPAPAAAAVAPMRPAEPTTGWRPPPSGPVPFAPAPPPAPGRPAPTSPPGRAAPGRSGRRVVPVVALIGVIALAGTLVAGLTWRVLRPGDTEAVTVTAAAFDPFGRGDPGEHDERAPLAVDGDLETSWETEGYGDTEFNGKGGVGLIFEMDERRAAERLEVTSPSQGWTADVYVLDERPSGELDSWDPPVATTDAAGAAAIGLDGAEGRLVLLWLTRTDDEGRVEVAEAVVRVRS